MKISPTRFEISTSILQHQSQLLWNTRMNDPAFSTQVLIFETSEWHFLEKCKNSKYKNFTYKIWDESPGRTQQAYFQLLWSTRRNLPAIQNSSLLHTRPIVRQNKFRSYSHISAGSTWGNKIKLFYEEVLIIQTSNQSNETKQHIKTCQKIYFSNNKTSA